MTELLTVDEAASYLRIHRASLYRRIAEGRIRVVHPTPGRTCVERRELDAYVASLRRRSAA